MTTFLWDTSSTPYQQWISGFLEACFRTKITVGEMSNNATHKDRSDLENNDRSNLDREDLDGSNPESKMLTYG